MNSDVAHYCLLDLQKCHLQLADSPLRNIQRTRGAVVSVSENQTTIRSYLVKVAYTRDRKPLKAGPTYVPDQVRYVREACRSDSASAIIASVVRAW